MLITPPVELRPNNVPCGPRKTSIRAISKKPASFVDVAPIGRPLM